MGTSSKTDSKLSSQLKHSKGLDIASPRFYFIMSLNVFPQGASPRLRPCRRPDRVAVGWSSGPLAECARRPRCPGRPGTASPARPSSPARPAAGAEDERVGVLGRARSFLRGENREGGRRTIGDREGRKQFGHRIKKKPRCSVVIEVPETGESYRFTP